MTIKTLLRTAIAVSALTLPVILGGCATQESVNHAQATADQALATAQSASAKADAASQKADAAAAQAAEANSKVDQMFQKSLRK